MTVEINVEHKGNVVQETIPSHQDDRIGKVIDRVAETAKDVVSNTRQGVDKLQDATEKAQNAIGDRAAEAVHKTKDLSKKAANKVGEAIDSVKDYLGR